MFPKRIVVRVGVPELSVWPKARQPGKRDRAVRVGNFYSKNYRVFAGPAGCRDPA